MNRTMTGYAALALAACLTPILGSDAATDTALNIKANTDARNDASERRASALPIGVKPIVPRKGAVIAA